jgi:hypothetical protein
VVGLVFFGSSFLAMDGILAARFPFCLCLCSFSFTCSSPVGRQGSHYDIHRSTVVVFLPFSGAGGRFVIKRSVVVVAVVSLDGGCKDWIRIMPWCFVEFRRVALLFSVLSVCRSVLFLVRGGG